MSTDPADLPYYAVRSLLRMFIALILSVLFTFVYAEAAARVMRLTKWERFWRLDVPGGMIPLVWNGMMSFGGGWFFLAASESISVLNHTYALPGIGSYVTAAIGQGSLGKVGLAIGVEIVLVIAVNMVSWWPGPSGSGSRTCAGS